MDLQSQETTHLGAPGPSATHVPAACVWTRAQLPGLAGHPPAISACSLGIWVFSSCPREQHVTAPWSPSQGPRWLVGALLLAWEETKGFAAAPPPPNKRANTTFGKRNKHKMFYTYYRHQQVPTVIHERDLGRKAIPLLRAAFLIRVSWSWLYCPNFKMRDLQAGRLSDLPNYRNII